MMHPGAPAVKNAGRVLDPLCLLRWPSLVEARSWHGHGFRQKGGFDQSPGVGLTSDHHRKGCPMLTDSALQERHLRRLAARQGYRLTKARSPRLADPCCADHVFYVMDADTNALLSSEWDLNVEQVGHWLRKDQAL